MLNRDVVGESLLESLQPPHSPYVGSKASTHRQDFIEFARHLGGDEDVIFIFMILHLFLSEYYISRKHHLMRNESAVETGQNS